MLWPDVIKSYSSYICHTSARKNTQNNSIPPFPTESLPFLGSPYLSPIFPSPLSWDFFGGGLNYVVILELNKIMCDKMKRKVKKVYQKRITILTKTRLNRKNLFLAINIWTISVIRYSAAFLDWENEEKNNLTVGLKNS